MKPIVAAFDFDGTLSRGVSGLRFFRELLGPAAYSWFWLRQLPALISYGLRTNHEASLERINRHIFTHRRTAEVATAGEKFAQQDLSRHLWPDMVKVMLAHRDRGDRCVVVSRGYEAYLRPWARSVGIHDVLCTRLESGSDGRLTGAMPEPSCDGDEKVRRLLRLLGDRDAVELHAYGDGPGDFPLFQEADCAFIRSGSSFQPWISNEGHS